MKAALRWEKHGPCFVRHLSDGRVMCVSWFYDLTAHFWIGNFIHDISGIKSIRYEDVSAAMEKADYWLHSAGFELEEGGLFK